MSKDYINLKNNQKISSKADFLIMIGSIIDKTKLKKKDVFEDMLLEAFDIGFKVARLDVNK